MVLNKNSGIGLQLENLKYHGQMISADVSEFIEVDNTDDNANVIRGLTERLLAIRKELLTKVTGKHGKHDHNPSEAD